MTDDKPQTPSVVVVEWRDALNATSGWVTAETSREYARDAFDHPLSAAGFLVEENDDFVVVAVAWNPHPDDAEVSGALMIPRSEVVSIVRLRE
jgi:hypothetical protein